MARNPFVTRLPDQYQTGYKRAERTASITVRVPQYIVRCRRQRDAVPIDRGCGSFYRLILCQVWPFWRILAGSPTKVLVSGPRRLRTIQNRIEQLGTPCPLTQANSAFFPKCLGTLAHRCSKLNVMVADCPARRSAETSKSCMISLLIHCGRTPTPAI